MVQLTLRSQPLLTGRITQRIRASSNFHQVVTKREAAARHPIKDGLLLYPKGMLVGSKVIFSGLVDTGTHKLKAADNYNVSGRSYT